MSDSTTRLARVITLTIGSIAHIAARRFDVGPGDHITRTKRRQVCMEIHDACQEVDDIINRTGMYGLEELDKE